MKDLKNGTGNRSMQEVTEECEAQRSSGLSGNLTILPEVATPLRDFQAPTVELTLQASWMPRFAQSAGLSNMNELPLPHSDGSADCRGVLSRCWSTVHKRFYFQDSKLEEDYLVYYLQNRAAPLCLIVLQLAIASVSAISFVQSVSLLSVIFRCVVFFISSSSLAVALILQREWDQLLLEEQGLVEDEVEDDAGLHSHAPRSNLQGIVPRRQHQGPSLARRHSLDLLHVIERKRANAASQELLMIWCTLAFYFGSASFYFIKSDCLGAGNVCMSGIYVDGTVVFAYLSSACACRARFLHHTAHIIVATTAYLTLRNTVPTSKGFPTHATQYFLTTLCCVIAALTIATIWLVERTERWFFFARTLAEKRKMESDSLARYCKAIASSMMPSHVVVQLSQGNTYVDHIPSAAVCAVSFASCDTQVYKELSPHELVQILQHGAVTLDSCLAQCPPLLSGSDGGSLIKVHSSGDCYMIVSGVGGGEDSAATKVALDKVYSFLRMFASKWKLNNTVDGKLMSALSLSFNDDFVKPFAPIAAIDVGEVYLTGAGRLSFVALGAAVRNVQCILRYIDPTVVRDAGNTQCCASSHNGNNCVLHLRLTEAVVALTPFQPATANVAHVASNTPNEAIQPTSSTLVVCADEWCTEPRTIHNASYHASQRNPLTVGANPMNAVSWFVISPRQSPDEPQSLSLPSEAAQHPFCVTITSFSRNKCGLSAETSTPLLIPVNVTTTASPTDRSSEAGASPQRHNDNPVRLTHSSIGSSVTTLASLRLGTTWVVFPTFEDEGTEMLFRNYAQLSTVDNDRSRWEFFFINCMMAVILALLGAAGAVNEVHPTGAVFWIVIALIASLCGTVMLATTTSEVATLFVLRFLEFVCAASFIVACFLADASTPFGGSGGIIWLAIVAAAIAARERRQGLGFQFFLMVLATTLFALRSARLGSPKWLRAGDIASQMAVCVSSIAALALLDRFRREQYVDERSLEILERAYAEHATSLQQLLKIMIPSKVVDRLMTRHTAAVALGSAVGADRLANHAAIVSLWSKTAGYRSGAGGGRHRLRTRNLWQSPFTTTSEDSPILLIRVHPRVSRNERKTVEDEVSLVDDASRIVGTVLRGFETLSLVNVCGTSMMIADQCETCESTDRCLSLAQVIGPVVSSLRCAGIAASAAITVGPMVGAIVGTVAITFEYFGQAPASCSAILDAIEPSEVIATGRFVEFVRLAQRVRQPILHKVTHRPPDAELSTCCENWSEGVSVGAAASIALRRFGVLRIHRIEVALSPVSIHSSDNPNVVVVQTETPKLKSGQLFI